MHRKFRSGTPVTLTATPAQGTELYRLERRLQWHWQLFGNDELAAESVSAAFHHQRRPAQTTGPGSRRPRAATPIRAPASSPCLTFAAALAQTPAGGEIDVLDPGDFGPVTITKSVSIYGDAPGVAGAIPSPGTSGIVVSAGSSDVISLHGLVFDGVNASGTSGVVFTSGARLNINQCVFQGFTTSGMTLSPGAGSAATTLIGRAGHDDPQQRDRHLDPADRRHRRERQAATAAHRQQYRRRTAGRRHRRLRRDQCRHRRQLGELQRRQRHRRGQRPGQRHRGRHARRCGRRTVRPASSRIKPAAVSRASPWAARCCAATPSASRRPAAPACSAMAITT